MCRPIVSRSFFIFFMPLFLLLMFCKGKVFVDICQAAVLILFFQNIKPIEKLSTFFLRLNMRLFVLKLFSVSVVVNPLEMLCSPYSNEKSKNTREMLIPTPVIKLKLIG